MRLVCAVKGRKTGRKAERFIVVVCVRNCGCDGGLLVIVMVSGNSRWNLVRQDALVEVGWTSPGRTERPLPHLAYMLVDIIAFSRFFPTS